MKGTAEVATNRRRRGVKILRRPPWLYRGVINAPNRAASPIRTIDVITIGDVNRPEVLVWSVACHPTSSPLLNAVTAEFIGEVRSGLRRRYGDIPVLFLQGGAGDVRSAVSVPHGYRRVAAEVKSLFGPKPWIQPSSSVWSAWCAGLVEAIIDARPVSREPLAARDGGRASVELSLRRSGRPVELVVERTVITESVELIGLNAEIMSSHPDFIRQHLGNDALVYGYAGDVFGYFPRTEMVADGGYEVDLHYPAFGIEGTLERDPDQVVQRVLGQLPGFARAPTPET